MDRDSVAYELNLKKHEFDSEENYNRAVTLAIKAMETNKLEDRKNYSLFKNEHLKGDK